MIHSSVAFPFHISREISPAVQGQVYTGGASFWRRTAAVIDTLCTCLSHARTAPNPALFSPQEKSVKHNNLPVAPSQLTCLLVLFNGSLLHTFRQLLSDWACSLHLSPNCPHYNPSCWLFPCSSLRAPLHRICYLHELTPAFHTVRRRSTRVPQLHEKQATVPWIRSSIPVTRATFTTSCPYLEYLKQQQRCPVVFHGQPASALHRHTI